MLPALKKLLLSQSPAEASFAARGFEPCDPAVRSRLERIIQTFLAGYNRALETAGPDALASSLDASYDAHHVGFAYEGIGLWFALLDLLFPRRQSRLGSFITGPGRKHDYIITVGAGFAVARVPWGLRSMGRLMEKLDPLIGWCIPDGYGFHQGFFHHRRYIEACEPPPAQLPEFGRQLFDSGIGRSLWWVKGADPARIATAIGRFSPPRRAELWCGAGVAAIYAGGADRDCLRQLAELAGPFRNDFLCGAPFAARMRQKGGNPSLWTEEACRLLLDATAEEVSDRASRCIDTLFGAWHGSSDELRAQAYPLARGALMAEFDRAKGPDPHVTERWETSADFETISTNTKTNHPRDDLTSWACAGGLEGRARPPRGVPLT